MSNILSSANPTAKKMLPRMSPSVRWIVILFSVIVVYLYYSDFSTTLLRRSKDVHIYLSELEYIKLLLKSKNVGSDIDYASRTIRYIPDAAERKSITTVHETLFPQLFTKISLSEKKTLPASKLLDLHVKQSPRLDEIDATSLMFGVSTTFERFHDAKTSPVKEWSRWLTDGNGKSNGAVLVLALLNSSSSDIEFATQQLATAGINATVIPSNVELDMPGRYVDLVSMLYHHPTTNLRKWFVLIDDDTFFPYMHELQRTLSVYNPSLPYYIGTFTERMDWMLSNHAPFAYGGGGIFMSLPTIKQISEAPCLKKNEDGSYFLNADQGDRLLLTHLPLLHQLDQFGDPSGFYESGRQPLSLHHYKSWHRFSPEPSHLVSDACGEDCVLQRFQFTDDYILTNGYSLAHYPHGIDFDPELMEHTFEAGDKNNVDLEETVFSYAFGQLRPDLTKTGRKKSWELIGARREGPGRVKQVYFLNRDDDRWRGEGETPNHLDSVVVLNWVP
ncbi:hypothetical protein Golomagni_00266 [Golovinomyces magnicellulatus]|nr:hypothetical protein Golomagni_00266 [Golovinomyces magnicellulatus]